MAIVMKRDGESQDGGSDESAPGSLPLLPVPGERQTGEDAPDSGRGTRHFRHVKTGRFPAGGTVTVRTLRHQGAPRKGRQR